jgi:putative transposase
VSGRKRHLLVDTQGFLLKVVVSGAEVQDRDGGYLVAHAVRLFGPSLPRLALIWADAAYGGAFVEEMRELLGCAVEIVKRSDEQRGFQVQPHRWIVERSFGWFGGFRRLSKDYEYELESSEAMIYAGMSHLLLRRLAKHSPPASSPDG